MASAPIFPSPPPPNATPALLPHQMFDALTQRLMLLPQDQTTRRRAGDTETVGPTPTPTPLPSPSRGEEDDQEYLMYAPQVDYYEAFMTPPEIDDGLPEEVIARFLNAATSEKKPAAGGDRELCAVCLDDLSQEDDRSVGVLGCRHGFHGDCIVKWLQKKNVCPLCRGIAIQIL